MDSTDEKRMKKLTETIQQLKGAILCMERELEELNATMTKAEQRESQNG